MSETHLDINVGLHVSDVVLEVKFQDNDTFGRTNYSEIISYEQPSVDSSVRDTWRSDLEVDPSEDHFYVAYGISEGIKKLSDDSYQLGFLSVHFKRRQEFVSVTPQGLVFRSGEVGVRHLLAADAKDYLNPILNQELRCLAPWPNQNIDVEEYLKASMAIALRKYVERDANDIGCSLEEYLSKEAV